MSVAGAAASDSETDRERGRDTDPQFGDVRVVVLRVAVDPERVMVGEQEGNLSKLIIGGEMKLRRLPPLFPPLCVLHWERASSSAHWFSSNVPLISLKSSSGRENNGAAGGGGGDSKKCLQPRKRSD